MPFENPKAVTFTKAGRDRWDKMMHEVTSQIESEMWDRKHIPGAEEIEITASDVEDLWNSMRIVHLNRQHARYTWLSLVLSAYLAIGLLMTAIGIGYPYLGMITQHPVQSMLIIGGMTITAFAGAMFFS